MFFTYTGYAVWGLFSLALLAILLRALWDGYRAFTVVIWAREITLKKHGNFAVKAQVRFFFRQWWILLFTYSGQVTISGPDGYWHDHNNWKTRALKSEVIDDAVNE